MQSVQFVLARPMTFKIHHLDSNDTLLMEAVLKCFAEAFDDPDTYNANRPGKDYLKTLLGRESFIVIAAQQDQEVVGAIAAYELTKFEQARSELYIYDLAVKSVHRRQGVATAMINHLKEIARERRAYVIFVQADTGIEDQPAIALYSKLGVREDVLHFDIPVSKE